MKEAQFYRKLKNSVVQCELCPHYCTVKYDELGKCRVRKNIDGILYSLSYEQPVAINIDPIEKKPFYHFLPGSKAFSIGMAGCNLRCKQCQNWGISQKSPGEIPVLYVKAKDIVKEALKSKCPSISYTYSEPLVSYEYMLDIAKLAKKEKIKNTIVSNGFINPEPLKELCKYIDGANIDLKSINPKFYENVCRARLEPVLQALKLLKKENVWLEITNLIIPTLNDKASEIKRMVKWIKDNLGADVPVHFSAFFPCFELMNLPATSIQKLEEARKIAMKELNYVYTGNLRDEKGSTTYCQKSGKIAIKRQGFRVIENNVKNGLCSCREKIAGVF